MNKTDLVSKIADKMEISLTQAEGVIAAFLEGIAKTLKKGETVSLVGFGRFGVKQRAARKVKNPRTGAEMQVKAKSVPFFKAGKELKETVDL
jgi:DNA-binding protein HU-beta